MQNFKEYLKENEIQDITLYDKDLVNGKLTKQYPDIEGYFDCSDTNLISLKFVPQSVGGSFYCYKTDITSLEFAPQYVGGNFSCDTTDITSLKFAPKHVGGNFNCGSTKITSLEFVPQSVGGSFGCSDTKITSLKGIGKDYLKEVRGEIYLNDCHELKSNMLGLMLVKGLLGIEFNNNEIEEIFNRHLQGERDILDCQEELITNGFKEYAKL